MLGACDAAAPPASLVQLDGTGSSLSDSITAERMEAVASVTRQTAVCSGHLRVLVFSASSAATTVLFDGSLAQPGATDNARLRRVPEAVEGVMTQVRAKYGPAVAALPQGGSDITAQLRLGAEWIAQLGKPFRLHLLTLTDGFQTVGVDLGARVYSTQEIRQLADQPAVPKLTRASVTIAGLGRIAEGTPPSVVAEGLIAYYQRLCERTGAASCVSVTDYAPSGR